MVGCDPAPGPRIGVRGRLFGRFRTTLAGRTASVRDDPVDAGALLARIRRRREGIGKVDVREETLRILRDAGR